MLGLQEALVLLDYLVQTALLEMLDHVAHLEDPVLQGPLVKEDLLDRRVLLEVLVLLEQ